MVNEAEYASPAAGVELLGESDAFLSFLDELARVAPVERPVLLIGERGTGKELAAARLHYLSHRWGGPLRTVNCAALAESLLEAELFGADPGAYTGAGSRRRPGRFEQAHGGSLFLDEIGALSLAAQEKVLRAVEYGVFERVGGSEARVDVRLVGATNADLPGLAEEGRFKLDLLDRLAFCVLTLPPLRAREGDAGLLAGHFAASMAVELGLDAPPAFSPRCLEQMADHPWPGNVRELKNAVERAVFAHAGEGEIPALDLDPFASPYRQERPGEAERPGKSAGERRKAHVEAQAVSLETPLPERVADLQVALVREALARARHNQRRAAELLGLTYHQFRALYRKHRQRIEGA
ncbi:sigma 54-interacting transcriptional regulator [Desulfohalovibrio reitneri]|uniref:sigma 54-interacting transcriptional regulator n=1 Tax=Desulfohalovibrio reitneri TaxID=1307759 RepID=UPI0004A6C2BB|nr:sigma 54-interacting transcriptional regulator [Desulfohalovibrio reitneri]